MQKATYCVIPFMRTAQNRPVFRDRKQTRGCLGRGRGERGAAVSGYGASFWGGEHVQELDRVMDAQHCVYTKNHLNAHF